VFIGTWFKRVVEVPHRCSALEHRYLDIFV
jgi:hypothetical protein